MKHYLLNCDPLLEEELLQKALPFAEQSRRQRVLQIHNKKNKALSLGAGLLTLYAVCMDADARKEYSGGGIANACISPEDAADSGENTGKAAGECVSEEIIRVTVEEVCRRLSLGIPEHEPEVRDEHDKPFIPGAPFYSLSHAGSFVFLAWGYGGPVGADIQDFRKLRSAAVYEKVLAEEELDFIRQLPAEQRMSCFFRFWAAKEACVKKSGVGIGIDLKNVKIELQAGKAYFENCTMNLEEPKAPEGYAIMVCS